MPLGQRVVLDLAIGIASGMAHLHERNVIHGDLNPANMLLKEEEDFGCVGMIGGAACVPWACMCALGLHVFFGLAFVLWACMRALGLHVCFGLACVLWACMRSLGLHIV